jgi:hypothetical protein
MDDLPQELIDNISSFLPLEDLKNTLTVSRKFQVAAEICSQAFARFEITEENSDKFLAIYGGHRRRYLRSIWFRPVLPALDTKSPKGAHEPCRDSANDLVQADRHFTSQIHRLFSVLGSLESRMNNSDFGDGVRLTIFTPSRLVLDSALYCQHRAYVSWRIHLLAPETLPPIKFIDTLVIRNGRDYSLLDDDLDQGRPSLRSLDLRILIDLANKLPRLRRFICKVGGEDWMSYVSWAAYTANQYRYVFEGPMRDSRHSFANLAPQMQFKDLKDLDLDFLSPMTVIDWTDQRKSMPNLVAPASHDLFSTALRILSYPLRRLSLRGVFDDTLFCSRNASEHTPDWPNLEILNVAFHPVSPTGAWYFRGLEPESVKSGFEVTSAHYPPYETSSADQANHDDYDTYIDWDDTACAQFRAIPNDELIEPLLTAFARATKDMPSLKAAVLWSPLQFLVGDVGHVYETIFRESEDSEHCINRILGWGVIYTAPGFGMDSYQLLQGGPCTKRQLWWKVANWRPTPVLREMFQGIGNSAHRSELIEHWKENSDWTDLEDRHTFENATWRYHSWEMDSCVKSGTDIPRL